MTLFAVALAFLLGGAALAALTWRTPSVSSALAVVGAIAGSALGEVVAFRALLRPADVTHVASWAIPYGQIRVAIDPLSAFFLVPLFALAPLAAVYGRAYLGARAQKRKAFHWLAFDLLVASMACVVVARQAVLFLFAWEIMSIAAYVVVTFEHERAEVSRAGWTYLIATHVGMAFLLAMFQLFARHAGSFDFDAIARAGDVPRPLAAALFFLAVLGFGIKAGLVPMHVWLPEAHAAAPSHVSALMSGVVIKMGIYGLLRSLLLIGRPAAWWGPTLVALGLASALVGISFALYQRDLKRVLAYSSVENVGIIIAGLGVAFWGVTSQRPLVAVLGATGALLHVWNHTLLKGALFLSAGSVLHGAGTKDLERLGGLSRRMPRTALAMTLGAVGIAALPPLNAFASEWLVYLGLSNGLVGVDGAPAVAVAIAITTIAVVGALTVLCFVRLIGVALLGQPRSEQAAKAHESPAAMTAPILILALGCVGMAAAPHVIVRAFATAVSELVPSADPISAAPSLATLATIDGVLLALLALGLVAGRALVRPKDAGVDQTWGCGYAAPTPRMQYTARSFAEMMAERLMPGRLGPRVSAPSLTDLFPRAARMDADCADPLTRGAYEPLLSGSAERFTRVRWVQRGSLHAYLLYILVVVLGLLAWISLPVEWGGS